MIDFILKKDSSLCCGCGACVSVCAHKALTFHINEEGYKEPVLDESACVGCGLCDSVCPMMNAGKTLNKPKHVYAAINNNVAFKDKIPYAYKSFCIDGDAFYISYVGDYMVNGDETKDFGSYIFKFDFDGNLLESYHSPVYIGRLSKISGKDTFYCRSIDKQGSTVLCRLK